MSKIKYFPKRIKLKVKLKLLSVDGLIEESTIEFSFKTHKEAEAIMDDYREIYKPNAVRFILVNGMIQVVDKPAEFRADPIMGITTVIDICPSAPSWTNNKDIVFGVGFEGTLYVAKPDFSNVFKVV